jgi:cutinase
MGGSLAARALMRALPSADTAAGIGAPTKYLRLMSCLPQSLNINSPNRFGRYSIVSWWVSGSPMSFRLGARRATSAEVGELAGNGIRRVCSAAVLLTTLLGAPIGVGVASAAPCADVQVIFARGTFEPVGIGATGESFVDSLRSQVGATTVDVYPVNYPASLDFATAADGVIDASNEVRDTAANCPHTRMVLGGYSQGAAVIGYITADAIPDGFTLPDGITGPMAPSLATHVAAVALFGKPSTGFLNIIDRDAPPITIGHLYTAKAIDLCIPEDPVCAPAGNNTGVHGLYAVNGMTDQAATFTARHLPTRA